MSKRGAEFFGKWIPENGMRGNVGADIISVAELTMKLFANAKAAGDGTQDAAYYANCGDCPGDGPSGGRVGPNRTTRAEAQADADARNRNNPGHSAVAMSLK